MENDEITLETVRLDMICTCPSNPEADNIKAKRNNISVTDLFHSLWHGYGCNIEILCDMWLGIGVDSIRNNIPNIYVTCDEVEDGLVAILEYLKEHFEEEE